MPAQNSSHFAMRQGNRRGEWATACGQSVRERSLCSLEQAEWIVCPECRTAALAARDAMREDASPASPELRLTAVTIQRDSLLSLLKTISHRAGSGRHTLTLSTVDLKDIRRAIREVEGAERFGPESDTHEDRGYPPPENRICRCGHPLNYHENGGCALNSSCLCQEFVQQASGQQA